MRNYSIIRFYKILFSIIILLIIYCSLSLILKLLAPVKFHPIKNDIYLDENVFFPIDYVLDSRGERVNLKSIKNKVVIYDFWFKDCPECLIQLNKVSRILDHLVDSVTIVSVCINRPDIFRDKIIGNFKRYPFMSVNGDKLLFTVMDSKESSKLGNDIPIENLNIIGNYVGSNTFPVCIISENSFE